MFIYFTLVICYFFFFTKKKIANFFQNEAKQLIAVMIKCEYEAEKKRNKLLILTDDLKMYVMVKLKNFVLLNNLRLKKTKIK